MRSDFDLVGDFHSKFDLHSVAHRGPGPVPVPPQLRDFRLRFLVEELKEFADAHGIDLEVTVTRRQDDDRLIRPDHAKAADSLIDLSYVTLGTAHIYGYPWSELFTEVQNANMQKERAVKAEQSTRGSTFDVVKPAGWRAPDIVGVLRRFGWDCQ